MAQEARKVGALTRAVSDELRAIVVDRQMTHQMLADKAGLPRPTASKILRGAAAIDLEQLQALTIALGVRADELLADARKRIGG